MRSTSLLAGLWLAFSAGLCARGQTPDLANLASLWRLDGDTADTQGANPGVFFGASAYVDGPRSGARAASLSGGSHIRCGTGLAFDRSTPFSVTVWVKGASSANDASLVGKMLHGSGYAGWELHVGSRSGTGCLNVWLINTYGANYIEVLSPAVVLDGSWRHVAFTYDGSSRASGVRIYADGADVTGSTYADSLTGSILTPAEVNLGARQNGAAHPFTGALAETAVWTTNLSPAAILALYRDGFPPPGSGPAQIVRQPESLTVEELTPVTFTAQASGAYPVALQWLRNGEPIPGATGSSLNFLAAIPDSGAQFALAASNTVSNIVCQAVSSNATLTVLADTTPPDLLRVQSLSLNGVQLGFSEPLQAATATNAANYSLSWTNGRGAVTSAVLSSNGTRVTLATTPLPSGGACTIAISGVTDRAFAPNSAPLNASFVALPFTTLDIGANATGAWIQFTNDLYLLTAPGGRATHTSDTLALSCQPRSGDFDIRARVDGFSTGDVWARASLMAREDDSPGSRFVAATATPSLAGCFMEWRAGAGAALLRSGSYPPNSPGLWLRLKRSGSLFSAFAGIDGISWFRLGDVTLALSNTVLAGFAHTSGSTEPSSARLAAFGDNPSINSAGLPNFEPPGPSSRRTPIAITKIHYNPAASSGSASTEFVELFNSNPWPEDIGGWRLSGNIDYTFAPNTTLPGGGRVVVARSPGALNGVCGLAALLGPYSGRLKDSGCLHLRNEQDAILLEINYRNSYPWPAAPDGSGHSLVLKRPSYGENDPRAWAPSDRLGGSPGAFDSASPNPLAGVLVNEFLAGPGAGFIELYNHTASPVDLSGCGLSDRASSNRFVLPPGSTLQPAQFVAFDTAALGFALDLKGGKIFFREPGGRVLDALAFGPMEPGVAFGRAPDGAPVLRRLTLPTPGATNAPCRASPVVINEVLFNSVTGLDGDQFIELFNSGSNAQSLGGWKLSGGVDYIIPSNTTILPNGFLVIARNPASFLPKYPSLTASNIVGGFSGRLSGAGERLALAQPAVSIETSADGQLVTNTLYVEVTATPWSSYSRRPGWARGGGSSLELVDARADPEQPANWSDSDETSKAPWTIAEATGYLDTGATYQDTPIDRLELTAMGAGEWLLDDVEVRQANGPNLVATSAFETGLGSWTPQGNHVRSSLSASGLGYGGGRAFYVRASGDGDTGANRIRVPLASPLTPGQLCVIRAKARWLAGFPELALRVKGNYHELYIRCQLPAGLGTPGARNSRALANAGPAIFDVGYAPVLPAASEALLVTARVHDPDGVGTFRVRYRVDPSTTYSLANFHDDGLSGDAVAMDGLFTAAIPGRPSGGMVAFYAEAADRATPAVSSRYPFDAPANEFLVRFGEPSLSGCFPACRLWLSSATVSRWNNRPFLDNEPLPGSIILGNYRAIQFAQGAYAGSAARPPSPTPLSGPADFTFELPADDLFLGSDSLQKLRNPGTTPLHEPLSYEFSRRLGLPWMNFRLVAWFVNGNRHGLLVQDMETPNGDVVHSRFPDNDKGQLFKTVIRYEFDDVTATGATAAGAQWFGGVSHGAATLNNYLTTNAATGSPERKTSAWRRTYLPRGSRVTANDYDGLFQLIDAAADPASPQLRALADFDEWARHCAVDHMTAGWDSFAAENGQNMYFYKDSGTTWRWLPFDRNIVFTGSTAYDLFVSHTYFPDPPFAALQTQPDFRRAWWTGYRDLASRWMAPEFLHPWLDARSAVFASAGISAASTDSLKSWIATRRSFILQALQTVEAPFAPDTNSWTSTDGLVLLTGTAAPWITAITANARPLVIHWTSLTNWQASLPVAPGSNVIWLAGLDRAGAPASNALAQVSVVFTGTNAWPPLRINEWMADSSGAFRDPADNAKDDWFELYNPAVTNVSLAGWVLTDTPSSPARFIVPEGYTVPAGGFLFVWADNEPHQNSPNRPDLHVSFKLDKTGEAIVLYAPDGTLIDWAAFGPQTTGFSEGRFPDGSGAAGVMSAPTPGGSNAPRADSPEILSITTRDASVTLVIKTIPGFDYTLETAADPASRLWTPLGAPRAATGAMLTATDTPPGAQRFYRVRRTP